MSEKHTDPRWLLCLSFLNIRRFTNVQLWFFFFTLLVHCIAKLDEKVQLHQTPTVELLFRVKFLHYSVVAGHHLTGITMVTE